MVHLLYLCQVEFYTIALRSRVYSFLETRLVLLSFIVLKRSGVTESVG